MADKINHEELAISRLATQFRESVNLIDNIKLLVSEDDLLESVICDVIEKRYLENATGVQLDIIGEIVGQTRELIESSGFDYFGFNTALDATSFTDYNDNSLGGRFRGFGEATTGVRILSDVEYRSFIRARIAKNMTRSTPEDIISQLAFIFEVPLVIFVDGDTEYAVSIGKILSSNEKAILFNTDLIVKTAGVKANYVTMFDGSSYFGFQGVPDSDGMGTVDNTSLGGKFSTLI